MKSILLAAALLMAPGLALAADLSGAWTVSSSVGTTPITVNCTLVQKGEALTVQPTQRPATTTPIHNPIDNAPAMRAAGGGANDRSQPATRRQAKQWNTNMFTPAAPSSAILIWNWALLA